MIIDCPPNCNYTLLTESFALKYFNTQVAPLGNCVTFVGPWKGKRAGTSSTSALHFLWEIPRQLSFSGIEINWMLLPSIASHLTTQTQRPTEIVDNKIRTYTTDSSQDFGIITCDVSSNLLIGRTIGHIALHIDCGNDCFPVSTGLSNIVSTNQLKHVAREISKNGVQSFYALTSRLFFTECILNDDFRSN